MIAVWDNAVFGSAAANVCIWNDRTIGYECRMNLDRYRARFSVKFPVPLAETPRAKLGRVETHDGPAVLKVFLARRLKVPL